MSTKGCNKFTTPNKNLSLQVALGLASRLVLLASPVLAVPLIGVAASIFNSGFEQGFSGWEKEVCCTQSAETVSSPVRAGTSAAKFTLNKGDSDVAGSKRSEMRLGSVAASSEQTYRFSTFLPTSYTADPSFEIVGQWHEIPDFNLGETWRSPPLSLMTVNGQWQIHRRWDPNRVTRDNKPGPGGGTESIRLGSYATNVWTDWVFHVKWSYGSDGVLEIWKNGQLVLQKTGPNTYNDAVGNYFKIGIYKPDWKSNPGKSNTNQRVIYYDSVLIDKGDSSPPSPPPPDTQKLISENFSSSAGNFTVESGGGWSINSGKYLLTSTSSGSGANSNISVHKTPLTDKFTLTADATATATSSNLDDFSIIFNYQDAQNYYYASFNESNGADTNGLFKVSGKTLTQLADFNSSIKSATAYKIKIEKTDGTIKLYRDGKLQATANDLIFSGGKAGFGSRNSPVTFDDLKVE